MVQYLTAWYFFCQYPEIPPYVYIVEMKGLDENRQSFLTTRINDKAQELSSCLMLVALCEVPILLTHYFKWLLDKNGEFTWLEIHPCSVLIFRHAIRDAFWKVVHASFGPSCYQFICCMHHYNVYVGMPWSLRPWTNCKLWPEFCTDYFPPYPLIDATVIQVFTATCTSAINYLKIYRWIISDATSETVNWSR